MIKLSSFCILKKKKKISVPLQVGASPHQFLALNTAESVTEQRADKHADLADWGKGVCVPLLVSCFSAKAQPWCFQNMHEALFRRGKRVKHMHIGLHSFPRELQHGLPYSVFD